VCFIVFGDNVLRRIEGSGETIWFAVSSEPEATGINFVELLKKKKDEEE
jgi:hypothetical protein